MLKICEGYSHIVNSLKIEQIVSFYLQTVIRFSEEVSYMIDKRVKSSHTSYMYTCHKHNILLLSYLLMKAKVLSF
jgi:hypothetical protein